MRGLRARTTYQAVEDLLISGLKEAQDDGTVEPSADAQELGRLLLAVMQGIKFSPRPTWTAQL